MSESGLGCAKTPAVAPHVEISLSNCICGSQIILHKRRSMPCRRIVFSTFRGCMSFYTGSVIHLIPAIPACPVRPKSEHSANARPPYEYTPLTPYQLTPYQLTPPLRTHTPIP